MNHARYFYFSHRSIGCPMITGRTPVRRLSWDYSLQPCTTPGAPFIAPLSLAMSGYSRPARTAFPHPAATPPTTAASRTEESAPGAPSFAPLCEGWVIRARANRLLQPSPTASFRGGWYRKANRPLALTPSQKPLPHSPESPHSHSPPTHASAPTPPPPHPHFQRTSDSPSGHTHRY